MIQSKTMIVGLGLGLAMAGWCGEPVAKAPAAEAAAAEQVYFISVDKPDKVGDTFRIDYCLSNQFASSAMRGRVPYYECVLGGRIELTGTLTVLAVASNRTPSSVEVVVDGFTVATNGPAFLVAKKGDHLKVARLPGAIEVAVQLNGQPLDPRTGAFVATMLGVVEPEHTGTFGTPLGLDVKRRVGERWTLDSAGLARDAVKYYPDAKAEDFKGSGEFTGITRDAGAEWATVKVKLSCSTRPSEDSPWTITGCKTKTTRVMTIPLGDKPLRSSGTFKRNQVITRVMDNQDASAFEASTITITYQVTPLKR